MNYIFKLTKGVYFRQSNGKEQFLVTVNPFQARVFSSVGRADFYREKIFSCLYKTLSCEIVLQEFPENRIDVDLLILTEAEEYKRQNIEANRDAMAMDSWMDTQDRLTQSSEYSESDFEDFESRIMRDLENGDGNLHGS